VSGQGAAPSGAGRLAGKVCAITGASSGIGAAAARALAGEGAAVVAFARRFPSPPAGALALPPGRVTEVGLDVTDEAAVRACFAALPSLDLLLCAAGVGSFAPIHTAAVADLRAMLEVHIVGTFLCCREALRHMQPQRRGHIVNIGSIAASRAFSDCGGYTAAKAGQLGLTRVLAEEARPYDIRVTAVTLGAVDTPIWDDRPGFDRSRMMRAEDFAGFVVDLVCHPRLAVDEVTVMPPGGAL
jgi:NAD(P)-dependent dehydrogenase (short-subunit alcohol dehydrogenase family)